jgi:hypothetical protein
MISSRRLTVMIAATMLAFAAPMAAGQTSGQPPSGGVFARSGAIVLKVSSFDDAWMRLANVAAAHGGELSSSRTRTDIKGRKYGSLVFQIPAGQTAAMFAAAAAVGKLYAQNYDAVDNQSDYDGLARRVDSLRRHEQRLSGILATPRHITGGDILFLQDKLFRADVDAEMLLQQRQDMLYGSQTTDFKVQMFEPGAVPVDDAVAKIDLRQWYGYALLRARHEFERSAARGSTGLAYAAVYSPIWGPLLIAALLLLWLLWRLRRRIASFVIRLLSLVAKPLVLALRRLRASIGRRIRLE